MLDAPNTLEPSVSPADHEIGHTADKAAGHGHGHDDVGLVVTPADPAKLKLAGLLGGVALVAVLAIQGGARLSAHQALQATTAESATPTVNVVLPQGGEASAVVLPGRLEAWNEAPVFARTNGYLKRWDADIGDHVKAGQTLAEIDTPDVDQQLVAAKAALATADANRALADITAKRWDRLVVTHAVSQQEVDQNHGNLAAKEALENEARANVSRLQTLTDFKRLVAPFDGVVTSRATDIGSLIVAGDASSRPLFSVADISKLRLYVSVPQSYAAAIKPGLTAHFTVPDHPNQSFTAQLVRTAGAVNTQSGAMLIQLVFDNSSGLLRPGAYAQVSLDVDVPKTVQASNNLRIPASALLFRKEGTAVAVADKDGRVHVQPVTIAQDFGATLAIGSGLTPSDMVIDSPSDAIVTGDRVKPVLTREAPNAHS
jgi:RND family efflux transporter MFP subunit